MAHPRSLNLNRKGPTVQSLYKAKFESSLKKTSLKLVQRLSLQESSKCYIDLKKSDFNAKSSLQRIHCLEVVFIKTKREMLK